MAASAPISPLAPKTFPALPPIDGVRFAAGAAGVRYQGRTDVMLALFDRPAAVAGVFTRSKCPSATVDWCRAALSEGRARALVVNSGNANAFTGAAGVATDDRRRQGDRQGDRRGAERDLPGLDRRHRRADGPGADRQRARRADRRRQARPADGRGAGDHDHRHLSQGRDRPRQARRRRGDDQRHRQRRRHDRPRHGDDAVVRLHRRADRRAGAAGAAQQGRSSARSTPSPSIPTPRPPTRC